MDNVTPSNLPWQCGTCKARFFKVELLDMHLKRFHSPKQKSMPTSIVQRIRSLYASEPPQPPGQPPSPEPEPEAEAAQEQDDDEQMYVVVSNDGTMYMIQNDESNPQPAIIVDEDSQHTTQGNVKLQIANGEIHLESGEVHIAEVQTEGDEYAEAEEGEVVTGDIVTEDDQMCEIITDNGEIQHEGDVETTEIVTEETEYQEEYVNGEISTYGEVQTDEDVEYPVGYIQYEDSSETAEEQMEGSDQEGVVASFGQDGYKTAPVFPCKKCDQVFSTKHDRRLHHQTHVRDLRFFCNVCGRGFHRYPLLKLHSNVHVDGKQHQCPHCSKFYRSLVYLKKHIAMHGNAAAARFECGVCGARAALRADLRRHMETHATQQQHRPPRQPNRCTICNIPIQRGLGYSRRCADCDAKFHGAARPKRNEEPGRPYQCSERGCFKSFRHPGHLRRHLATHMDDYD